jgi:PAS domain S-box-containing protein
VRSGSAKRKGSSSKESAPKNDAGIEPGHPPSPFGSVGSAMVGLEDIERIIDRMTEPSLVLDLGTRRAIRANAPFCRLSGFEPSDLSVIDLSRLFDLKDLEWILQAASKPQKERPVRAGVVCVGRDEKSFTSDVRVTVLAEKGGSLVLLTFPPPEAAAPAARARSAAGHPADGPLKPATAKDQGAPPPSGEGLQSALTTFTRGLAATRDREMLGQVLIESSERLMGSGIVILVSRRAASLGAEVTLSTGLSGSALAAAHRWLDTLMVNAVVSSGRPVVLDATSGEDAPGAAGEELAGAGAGALIVFPLESDGKVIGLWVLGYRDPASARSRDLEVGSVFAEHLAGTLTGLLLLERTRKEKAHQEVLNKIISCLRGPFDLDEFLKSLAGELCGALDADMTAILGASGAEAERGSVTVDFEYSRPGVPSLRAAGPIPFVGTALGQAVLFSKEPLVVEDLRTRPDLTEHHELPVERFDLRGLVMAKIVSRQGFRGVVAAATSGKPRRWAAEEVDLVRAVADHISVTLETGRLMKANEHRARQLNLLTEVQQAVGRLQDVSALMQEAVEALCRSFGYRQARIATISRENGELIHQAWAGAEDPVNAPRVPGQPHEETCAEAAARTGQVQIRGALVGPESQIQRAPEIALPLLGAGILLGVLTVQSERPADFEDEGRNVLERFAENLAVAIQNARLYEAERKRSRRMEILGALQSEAGAIDTASDLIRRAAQAIARAYPDLSVRITGVQDAGTVEFTSGAIESPVLEQQTARLALPIRKGHRELGVLQLKHRTALEFEEGDKRTFELLADRLAEALENAELFSQIERERREWERTFNAIPDMLSIHDGYGRLLRANRALYARLGDDARRALGRDCADLLETIVGRSGGCPHEEALREQKPLTREVQGDRGAFSLTAIPCFDQDGECLYIIHVCREITEEKQIREQLLHNEKMAAVGSLVSGVAHELNNPLAGVTGFAQLLLERHQDPALRKSLERIRNESERAAKIVKNLLAFARKHKPEVTRVAINELLEKTLELRAYEMRVSNIKVVTDLPRDLPLTQADPAQLQQVFLNVVVNAEQAMTEAHHKGVLTVSTASTGGRIEIRIEDDGPGIAPEHLKQIFEPFFTTKKVGKGTGLGLSICFGIIRDHGGTIAAESTLGRGTTFRISLPLVATVAKEAEPEEVLRPAAPAVPPATILVVDDEMSTRELIRETLIIRGHTVDAVESGPLALAALGAKRYDLVVSDLKMPEMTGQELFARVGKDDPGLAARFIFTSGDTVSPVTRSFLEGSGRPYLLKPFQVRDLVAEVEKALALHSGASRN